MTLAYRREKFENPAGEIPQRRNEPPFSVCLFQTFAQERSLKSFSHGLVSEKRTHGFIGISWDI